MRTYAVLVGVLGLVALGSPTRAATGPEALLGKEAPNFKLELLGGGEFELAAQEGKKVVVLNFWATYCPTCVAAMPTLTEVAKEYESKDVLYLAVNSGEHPARVLSYLKRAGYQVKVPLDNDGRAAELYNVYGIPALVVIDKKGIVRATHLGGHPNLKVALSNTLDMVLKPGGGVASAAATAP